MRLIFSAVAITSLMAGILTAQWLEQRDRKPPTTTVAQVPIDVPDQRVDFTLPDLAGKDRSLSEWDGKVILLNFWATWCPPCRKEMPDFVELREELAGREFEIIGVALDTKDLVQAFVDGIGVEYPVLLAELEGMQIMKSYGNQLLTLPYTVLIDRQGKVVKAFRTEVNREMLKPLIEPLL
jgi:peroxiredoxin